MVVDGNNLLVRSIKAMERTGLHSEEGIPTGALHSFINGMSTRVREHKPDRVVVCWDGGRSFYRSGVYASYKADRPESHVDRSSPESPFAMAKEFLSLAGVHHVEVPQVEADDLIAAYWRTKDPEELLLIHSGDKDFFQLLENNTFMVRPGDPDLWDRERVVEVMDCEPRHIPLLMALTGDAGDGVPGLAGVGPKTAVKWLKENDWNLSKVLGRGYTKAVGQESVVTRALQLVDLRNDLTGVKVQPIPAFSPTDKHSILWMDLLRFIDRYELASVGERLLLNSLWR